MIAPETATRVVNFMRAAGMEAVVKQGLIYMLDGDTPIDSKVARRTMREFDFFRTPTTVAHYTAKAAIRYA